MHFLQVVFAILIATQVVVSKLSSKELKCLVCRSVVEEIDNIVQSVNPKKMVEVGSYRLDSTGNQKQKMVPYARSEIHMQEVLETVCDKMSDYVQATYKSSGEPLIMRIVTADGKMNPDIGKVDITPDDDLNKGLEYHCQTIVEEQEDDILRLFGANESNIDIRLCSDVMKVCDQTVTEDYNLEDHEEL